MAVARFKDLCLDAGDPARLGTFWSAVLGRTWEAKDGGGLVTGPTRRLTPGAPASSGL
jgi:glyoxalase superfamily protein